MAVTIDSEWNEATPAGSDDPKQGDDRIREDKKSTRERFQNGGHIMATTGTDAKDGRHIVGDATHGDVTGSFRIYKADGTTVLVDIRDSTAASSTNTADFGALQIKTTGGMAVTGASTVAALTASGAVIAQATLTVGADATVTNVNPSVTATYDLGATGVRFRDGWFSRDLTVGGNLTVTGTFSITTLNPTTLNVSGVSTLSGGVSTGGYQFSTNTAGTGSGTYTVAASDKIITLALTANNMIVALPASASSSGRELYIAIISGTVGWNVAVTRNGADTINGGTSFTITRGTFTASAQTGYQAIHIICRGTDWVILSALSVS